MDAFDSMAGVEVARLLLQCHRLEKGLASSAGLSVDEFHCISQLFVHAPCCVKALCELTGIHPTRASRILSVLERKGYLLRTLGVEDKRKESLTLTDAGVEVARRLLESCAFAHRNLKGLAGGVETQSMDEGANNELPGVRM